MTIVCSREIEGRSVLAIDSGMTSRAFGQSRLPQALISPGFIIHPSLETEEWIPEGTYCDETDAGQTMIVYGPSFSGISLLEGIQNPDKNEAWKRLYQCISLISRASIAEKISPEILSNISGAGPEAILYAEDGSVLILPADLYTRCLDGQGEKTIQENRLFWIHPDYRTLNSSWSFAFLAGTLAYRIASGVPPFKIQEIDENEDSILNMHSAHFEPLEYALWEIRPTAATCINSLISTKLATSTDTLLSFGPSYEGILDPSKVGIPESAEFITAKKKAEKKRHNSILKKKFIRKYSGTFKIAGVLILILATIAGSYISSIHSKPTTKGMTPLAIVLGYYEAISALDQEIPQAYTKRGLQTDYTDLTSNLYITAKVRESYEKGAGILSPAQLYASKSIGIKTVFGITALSIQEKSNSGTRAEYTASFYIWMPYVADKSLQEENTVQLSIYKYRDSILLEKVKNLWKITKVQKEERILVEEDGKKVLESIANGSALELPYAPTNEEIRMASASLYQ